MTPEERIDEAVAFIEEISEGKFICPKENRKNIYTKTCWLLSKYQRLRNGIAGVRQPDDELLKHFETEIKTLKEFLPIARQSVKEVTQ